MTPVIFGRFEIGLFTDDGRYLSHGRKLAYRSPYVDPGSVVESVFETLFGKPMSYPSMNAITAKQYFGYLD